MGQNLRQGVLREWGDSCPVREAALHVDASHSEGTDGLYNKIRTGIPSVRT